MGFFFGPHKKEHLLKKTIIYMSDQSLLQKVMFKLYSFYQANLSYFIYPIYSLTEKNYLVKGI